MRHIACIAPLALALGLAACEQPDEVLPPEGELESALPTEDMGGDDPEEEPELETIGEPEAPIMESGENRPGTTAPTQGSKLQRADPDY